MMRAKLYFCATAWFVAACEGQHAPDNRDTSDAAVQLDAARSDDNVPLDDTAHLDPLSANVEALDNVECEVTVSSPAAELNGSENLLSQPRTVAWIYDAATRRLRVDDFGAAGLFEVAYDLDELGHIVRVNTREADGEFTPKYTYHYDAYGRVDSSQTYAPPGETIFLNTYEGDRLIRVETGSRSAPTTTFMRWTYRYYDRAHPHMWTRIDIRSGAVDATIERTNVDGRVSTTRFTTGGILLGENTFIYVGDQIEMLDLTFAAMGELESAPYERYHWVRDAYGRLTEWTIDGSVGSEGRFPDGNPEWKRTFSESCAPLLETFPWLTSQPRSSDYRPSSDAVFPP